MHDRSGSERIRRWTVWAGTALTGALFSLVLRGVSMLVYPHRDQTLELLLTVALVAIAAVWFLAVLFRRKPERH
jgi:hypothetical protein